VHPSSPSPRFQPSLLITSTLSIPLPQQASRSARSPLKSQTTEPRHETAPINESSEQSPSHQPSCYYQLLTFSFVEFNPSGVFRLPYRDYSSQAALPLAGHQLGAPAFLSTLHVFPVLHLRTFMPLSSFPACFFLHPVQPSVSLIVIDPRFSTRCLELSFVPLGLSFFQTQDRSCASDAARAFFFLGLVFALFPYFCPPMLLGYLSLTVITLAPFS